MEPLLNGANPVPDSSFTASSEFGASYVPHNARLDGGSSFWGPTTADLETIPLAVFLQVSQV